VREYATPSAFRAAVEAKLRARSRGLGVAAYIVRRQAALERLMVRLTKVAPDRWALKGGLALETRLGKRARVSVDLDADHLLGAGAARADLQRATLEDVGDHFGFAIVAAEELSDAGVGMARRVFASRATHAIPGRLPLPPKELAVPYRKEAAPAGIATDLNEAHRLLAVWLDPILTDLVNPTAA
jgi:hypothetical protein